MTTTQTQTRVDREAPQTKIAKRGKRAFLKSSLWEQARGAFWSMTWQLLFRWSPPIFNWWRVWLLRIYGGHIGAHSYIAPSTRIDFPWNLVIGRGVVVAHRCIINCMGLVIIGDRTRVSQYAHICAGTHNYTASNMPIVRSPIKIGCDVWIAADAFVGPGVTIGDGSVLAARSSAFKALPPGMVCIGEPARPVRSRELGKE